MWDSKAEIVWKNGENAKMMIQVSWKKNWDSMAKIMAKIVENEKVMMMVIQNISKPIQVNAGFSCLSLLLKLGQTSRKTLMSNGGHTKVEKQSDQIESSTSQILQRSTGFAQPQKGGASKPSTLQEAP